MNISGISFFMLLSAFPIYFLFSFFQISSLTAAIRQGIWEVVMWVYFISGIGLLLRLRIFRLTSVMTIIAVAIYIPLVLLEHLSRDLSLVGAIFTAIALAAIIFVSIQTIRYLNLPEVKEQCSR
jgi:hypothetical protein